MSNCVVYVVLLAPRVCSECKSADAPATHGVEFLMRNINTTVPLGNDYCQECAKAIAARLRLSLTKGD